MRASGGQGRRRGQGRRLCHWGVPMAGGGEAPRLTPWKGEDAEAVGDAVGHGDGVGKARHQGWEKPPLRGGQCQASGRDALAPRVLFVTLLSARCQTRPCITHRKATFNQLAGCWGAPGHPIVAPHAPPSSSPHSSTLFQAQRVSPPHRGGLCTPPRSICSPREVLSAL